MKKGKKINKKVNENSGKESIFSKIISWISDGLLFIVLLPFNLFKYLNLGFYYIMKWMIRETPEKEKQRLEKEKAKKEELQKERERAKEYIKEQSEIQKTDLKFAKDINNEPIVHKDVKLTRAEQKEEHRIAKEKIRREKLRQKEEAKKEKKSVLEEFKKRNFFGRRRQQKLEKKRQILALDVNSADANRSSEKITFKYVGKNPEGKIEKGRFRGYSKLDVHSYLLSEGYEVYEINAVGKSIFTKDISITKPMKKSILVFYLTQLSTYLKAGIPIVDAMKILAKQAKTKTEKDIWKSIVYELSMGATLSEAMIRSGNVFPKLLINMVKTAEMTGDLSQVLDEQAEYYRSVEKSRKEMMNAMMYPIFVFVFAIIIVTYIIVSVVPQFVSIYDSLGADLPGITKFIINLSNFIRSKYLIIILVIFVLVFGFIFAFKKSVEFKSSVQYLLMHLPVIGDIIIYNEMTMFSKTFATLINNNIFITDSMDILGRITDNEIYKGIIFDAVTSLSKGDNLSSAFNDNWAFPDIAYQMIVTGEKTGQLGLMMEKVAEYYQEEHFNAMARIKALVEPLMIIFLAVIVGGILLAVIIPMFSMYQDII